MKIRKWVKYANPNVGITIAMPDGSPHTTTVTTCYDEHGAMLHTINSDAPRKLDSFPADAKIYPASGGWVSLFSDPPAPPDELF